MNNLIDLNSEPVKETLKILLKDKTTKKNIIWATSSYTDLGPDYEANKQITQKIISANIIEPRICKAIEQQAERSKSKGEVFTPSWICNKMNNHCDTEWFGKANVFNIEAGQTWCETKNKIEFSTKRTWKNYVDSKRLEITCGEAPYIASRYDTTTGEIIPVRHRIGILDRKLRVVNENTNNEQEWFEWVIRSYQSVYGYEFQGDNLLIARINLLMTFTDYLKDKWGRESTKEELRKIANIIAWNLWQMDGITGTIPFGRSALEYQQISFFDWIETGEKERGNNESIACRIYDWRADRSITYNSLKEKG